MQNLFFRCRYGHFIRGGCCPFDAWTHDQIELVESLFSKDSRMRVEDFAAAGIRSDLVRRIVLIDSVALPQAIEAIYPKCYVVRGVIDEVVDREW